MKKERNPKRFQVTAAIRESVESAKRKLEADATGLSRMKAAMDKACDEWAKFDAELFGAFNVLGPDLLDKLDPELREQVLLRLSLALNEKDGNFFIRFGRALQGTRKLPQFDNTDMWLTGAWLPQGKSRFGLCHCTDEVITKYCNHATGNAQHTNEAITKRRQRLGLIKHPKPCVIGLRLVDGKLMSPVS